jgi:hypothetical protein
MMVGVAIGDGGVGGGVRDDCKVSDDKGDKVSDDKGDKVSDEVVDNGVNDPK